MTNMTAVNWKNGSGITHYLLPYAPAENPKIAIGLIVENGEHGGLSAAPIARAVFDAYMQSRAQTNRCQQVMIDA